MPSLLRSILANNPSLMTLTGTRTWIVGRARVAVIDPGPADAAHVDAVAREVGRGIVASILLTHGHADHAGGARLLADRLGAPVLAMADGTLADGARIETDAGALIALHTPGHTPDHLAFHWARERAVFCGDLMLGGMDTALIASPEGDLAEYLGSLDRLRGLEPAVLHPAHGPSFERPADAIEAYVRHRHERLEQVRSALRAGPLDDAAAARAVYGSTIPPDLYGVAVGAARAYLEHLVRQGEAEAREGRFEIVLDADRP